MASSRLAHSRIRLSAGDSDGPRHHSGGADDRRRGAEAGARAYIVKGEFSKDSLLETVRMLVD